MSTQAKNALPARYSGSHKVDIDFLFLDLKTCTRCVGTDRNLEQALESVQQVLQFTGAVVSLNKTLIDSAEKAAAHRFQTSPTIRINGRDIALEMRESKCDSCTDLCGCAEGTDCRVWLYRGEEYTEAPVAMLVEAILQEALRTPQPERAAESAIREVPENLQRFFAGASAHTPPNSSACCSQAQQLTCCEPAEKAECCSGSSAEQSCGCQ
jgi:hypothetical protein